MELAEDGSSCVFFAMFERICESKFCAMAEVLWFKLFGVDGMESDPTEMVDSRRGKSIITFCGGATRDVSCCPGVDARRPRLEDPGVFTRPRRCEDLGVFTRPGVDARRCDAPGVSVPRCDAPGVLPRRWDVPGVRPCVAVPSRVSMYCCVELGVSMFCCVEFGVPRRLIFSKQQLPKHRISAWRMPW